MFFWFLGVWFDSVNCERWRYMMDKRIGERIDSIIENKDFLSELVSAKSKSDLYGLLS